MIDPPTTAIGVTAVALIIALFAIVVLFWILGLFGDLRTVLWNEIFSFQVGLERAREKKIPSQFRALITLSRQDLDCLFKEIGSRLTVYFVAYPDYVSVIFRCPKKDEDLLLALGPKLAKFRPEESAKHNDRIVTVRFDYSISGTLRWWQNRTVRVRFKTKPHTWKGLP